MRKLLISAALVCTGLSSPAQGFGLRTHLWMAEQILKDLRESGDAGCAVDVAGSQRQVPGQICNAILAEQGAFLAGAIGPDAFPDLVVGQSFVHPGAEDGRQTADWLALMLSQAKTNEEIAFAFGNIIHASGDIFAHSYVNNYSGDVFDLTADRSRDVELRHTLLEKYIDQRLDYNPPVDQLKVPTEFLVDTMVRTNYVPVDQRFTVEDLATLFANPTGEITSMLGSRIRAGAPGSHMMVMWGMLSLSEREQRKTPCRLVTRIDESTSALRTYIEAEYEARRADAERRQLPIPTRPDLSEVSEAATPCPEPTDEEMRGYPTDRDEQDGSAAELAAGLARARFTRVQALGQIEDEDLAINRRDQWWRTLSREERQNLSRSFEHFVSSVEARERQEALQIFADYWADDVRMAIERYMQASLATARDMVESSAPWPQTHLNGDGGATHYSRWFDCYRPVFEGQPLAMGNAVCDRTASLGLAMSLSEAARESGIGEFNRSILYDILSFGRWIDRQMTSVLCGIGRVVAPSLTDLVDTLVNPKRIGRDELDELFARGRGGLMRFQCVSDWIDADLGMLPRHEGAGFRPNAPCAMTDGQTYAARSSQWLDPDQFMALNHAVAFGRLALLDQTGLRDLTRDLAERGDVSPTEIEAMIGDIETSDDQTYSILLDTARSLDGSYQWNGVAMPYPRRHGYNSTNVDLSHHGYPAPDDGLTITLASGRHVSDRPGFPFYRTDDLRRVVFAAIFPEPFEGEILKAEQFGEAYYPFAPCPFDPFRSQRTSSTSRTLCETRE